jgi:glycosyltransferase involved in cell wall biosynthesis
MPDSTKSLLLFPKPKVVTIHDLYMYVSEDLWAANRVDYAMKSSNKIVTVSYFSQKQIMEHYHVNEKFCRAIPIRLGKRIQKSFSVQEISATMDKYKLLPQHYIIFVSSFWKNKNRTRLLQAFAKFVKATNSKLKLIMVGNCRDLNRQKKNAEEFGLQDSVVYTGFVHDNELGILLSNSLAFICPSLYEGFGMPVIEAMTAGIPVTCSNVASLPEITDGAALLFDPYNVDEMAAALAKITQDNHLRSRLIQKGYKQAERFSDTQAMIDEYLQTFEEVML